MNTDPAQQPDPLSRATQSGSPRSARRLCQDTPNHLRSRARTYTSNNPIDLSINLVIWCIIPRNQSRLNSVGSGEQIARTKPTDVAFSQQVARFRRRNVGADGGKSIKTNPLLPYWQTLSMDLLCKSNERTQRRHIGSLPLKIREERSRTSKSVLGMMSPSNIRPATNACTGLPAGNVENSRQRGMQPFRSYLTSALRCTRTPAPRDPERPKRTLPTTEISRPYLDHPHRPPPADHFRKSCQ
jgi:hypothetical protein